MIELKTVDHRAPPGLTGGAFACICRTKMLSFIMHLSIISVYFYLMIKL